MRRLSLFSTVLALLLAGASTQARKPSFSTLRTQVKQARQFERTMRSLARGAGDQARAADRVVRTLDSLRKGQDREGYWTEKDLKDALQGARLSSKGLEMALERAFRQGWRPRMKQALEQYAKGHLRTSMYLDPKTAELMGLIEGSRVHAVTGRKDLQQQARARANKLARIYGVDIKQALDADQVHYQISSSRRGEPTRPGWSHTGVRFKRFGPADDRYHYSGMRSDRWNLHPDESRRVGSSEHWWTGYQTAYLDLMYRRLPEMLKARFQQDPRQRTFRIWHAGSEEGSQTYLLAALVDTAVARLKRSNPEMHAFLDRLKLEIVATDLSVKVKQRGRNVRFMVDEIPMHTKSGLVAEELGWSERRAARHEVRQLEKELAGSKGDQRAIVLDKLADAGKVSLLMNRLFTLAPRVDADPLPTPVFNYKLRSRSWRVENDPAGQAVLNPDAKKRLIRFELSDLTKSRPRGKFDLAVCTNVLPWFGHYNRNEAYGHNAGRQDNKIQASLTNLSAGLRPGGTLLVDERSEQVIHRLAPQTLSAFGGAEKSIWVTRTATVEPIGPKPPEPAPQRW
jgi:hypothetical protein